MNFWKASTFVLTGLLGTAIAASAIPSAHADAQPKMQSALTALEAARDSLAAASDDKGGFRKKALDSTRDAIEQTRKGITFDNTHKSGDEKK